MKIQELRIGNLVHEPYDRGVETIYEILLDEVNGEIPDYFEPIPLTEDWLLKLGFEKDTNGYRLADLYSLSFTEKFMPCFNDRPISKNQLQYVHQLQNLYFVLTGEELKVK